MGIGASLGGVPMTPDAVLKMAQGAWSGEGHNWSDADLLAAGLTPNEIANFHKNAATHSTTPHPSAIPGGTGTWLAMAELMTQIAYHESGFIPDKHGTGPVDDSWGLWQINTLGPLWASIQSKYHLESKESLTDPATNLRIAHDYTEPSDTRPIMVVLHPWTGSWQKSLRDFANNTAQIQPGNTPEGSASPGVGSTDTQIPNVKGVLDMLQGFLDTITSASWWKRIGIGALGFLLIAGALVLYNKDTVMNVAAKASLA